jgi:choline dehydrogenase-like flavoprotein
VREPCDATVVGSGAGGAVSTYVLSHAGLKVLMLKACPAYRPDPKRATNPR